MRRTLKKTSPTSEVLLGERTLLEAGHALRVGRHPVTPLLMILGRGERENEIGALGLCRAGVGRLSRVRAHEGHSAADTLGAGRGCWARGASHLPKVRRTLSNVRRACLSRSGGVLSYPSLRWSRRPGNRRVNGRRHALSASWFRAPPRHAVADDLEVGRMGLERWAYAVPVLAAYRA